MRSLLPGELLLRVRQASVTLVVGLLVCLGLTSQSPAQEQADSTTDKPATETPATETQATDKPEKFDPQHPPVFPKEGMGRWKVADTFYFKEHGEVANRKGEIHVGRGKPGSGIRWSGPVARIDYEIQFKAKRTAGSDFFCGLTFPVNDDYCSLIIGGWGGGLTGLSNLDDFAADANQTTGYIPFKDDQWYAIRLRVSSQKIEAWIDDEQILTVETDQHQYSIWWEQEPLRPLGLATWNTGAAYKDWKYLVLEPSESTQ